MKAWRLVFSVLTLVVGASCTSAPRAETVVFAEAAVAADHSLASAAGAQILAGGGNAVDAAVATSFCLSVVRPYSCGIGGGGFMLIALPPDQGGEVIALDYRETAPAAVGPDYFQTLPAAATAAGVHAVGVPGTVAGLLYALDRYGTLDRRAVLAPAIALAEDGFPADANFVAAAGALAQRLEATSVAVGEDAGFLWRQAAHHGAIAEGDWVTNPEQARALRLIARDGADAFYEGPIADAIVDVMRARGGAITHDDLRGYTPRQLAPVAGRFGPYDVYAMPPPSSGGIAMLQIFGLLERQGIAPGMAPMPDDAAAHALVESMKHAFADRARWLADPAYVPVPVDDLLDPSALDGRAASIDAAKTQPPEAYGVVAEVAVDAGTSHLSIVDAQGLAVACTETINLRYGSLVVVPGFGFALNDEMDDFTTTPGAINAFGLRQSERNLPAPGKRPLSSMSPTIIQRDGQTILVAGASGGPRIITGTLQSILNCLVEEDAAQTAVNRPRLHHQWLPDVVYFEETWTDDDVKRGLEERGHVLAERATVGNVQLLRVTEMGIEAACDPRKGGAPAGY